MTMTTEYKAENWNFDFSLISDSDKEFLLRAYHGSDWYDALPSNERESWDALLCIELNALVANGLIKTGYSEYLDSQTGEISNFYEVFTHNKLLFSDVFTTNYLQRCDGESEAIVVDADTNEAMHKTLLSYRFW